MSITERVTQSARYIALIRTLAPLLWAGLISWFSDRQFDLSAKIASGTGLPEGLIDGFGPVLIAFGLWLIAVFAPSDLIERILLAVKVDGQAYSVGTDVVVDKERIRNDRVLILPDEASLGDRELVDAATDMILKRRPDGDSTNAAVRRLIDYTEGN